MSRTFIDDVLDHKASPADIDKYVDRWHKDRKTQVGLHVYLGLTHAQYARWVEKPGDIWKIVREVRQCRQEEEAARQRATK